MRKNVFVSRTLGTIKNHLVMTKESNNYVILNYKAVNMDVIKSLSSGPIQEDKSYNYIAIPKYIFKTIELINNVLKDDIDPCWDGYEMVGVKTEDGKEVPDCVPEKNSQP